MSSRPGSTEDVRQERVVDLNQDAGIGDGLVFLAHLGRERVEILFVGLVIFVDADAGGRGRGQEDVFVGNAGGLGRGFHIGDIALHGFFAAIFHRADADHRVDRHDRAAQHRLLEIFLIIFRKGLDLLLEQDHLLALAAPRSLPAAPGYR